MKNKDFFYLQYNKINWKNQEKTKINFFIYDFIIKKIILKKKNKESIKIFDIGFGIGSFIKLLYKKIIQNYKKVVIEGCEPSELNYRYLLDDKMLKIKRGTDLKFYKSEFLETKTNRKFDFITAIYVFPSFLFRELEKVVHKISFLLEKDGKFILVLANEAYLRKKLKKESDLFIEKANIFLDGKRYQEILHYADIPEIGKVIDYNREEAFYLDLFKKNNFKLLEKHNINDSGFICTLFIFTKS